MCTQRTPFVRGKPATGAQPESSAESDSHGTLAAAAAHSPQLQGQVAGAINQLVKTSKSLSGRLNRMGAAASLARPQLDRRVSAPLPGRFEEEPVNAPLSQAYLAQEEIDSASQ